MSLISSSLCTSIALVCFPISMLRASIIRFSRLCVLCFWCQLLRYATVSVVFLYSVRLQVGPGCRSVEFFFLRGRRSVELHDVVGSSEIGQKMYRL